jgi:hypothetical protein
MSLVRKRASVALGNRVDMAAQDAELGPTVIVGNEVVLTFNGTLSGHGPHLWFNMRLRPCPRSWCDSLEWLEATAEGGVLLGLSVLDKHLDALSAGGMVPCLAELLPVSRWQSRCEHKTCKAPTMVCKAAVDQESIDDPAQADCKALVMRLQQRGLSFGPGLLPPFQVEVLASRSHKFETTRAGADRGRVKVARVQSPEPGSSTSDLGFRVRLVPTPGQALPTPSRLRGGRAQPRQRE